MNAEKMPSGGTGQYQYRVVYSNGLGDPVETLIGSFDLLDQEDPDILDEVCQFVQSAIDMDCRKILFIYLENTITNSID
ncbi:MAG: hypothetical protein KTR33_14145 [Gammaproteobacteria bacterium]|nr:hypothetical protein [Gammaproteobacteria bacterium]